MHGKLLVSVRIFNVMKIGGLFEEHMTMIQRLQLYESIPDAEVSKREEENLFFFISKLDGVRTYLEMKIKRML